MINSSTDNILEQLYEFNMVLIITLYSVKKNHQPSFTQ